MLYHHLCHQGTAVRDSATNQDECVYRPTVGMSTPVDLCCTECSNLYSNDFSEQLVYGLAEVFTYSSFKPLPVGIEIPKCVCQ